MGLIPWGLKSWGDCRWRHPRGIPQTLAGLFCDDFDKLWTSQVPENIEFKWGLSFHRDLDIHLSIIVLFCLSLIFAAMPSKRPCVAPILVIPPRYHFPWGCPKIKGSSREQEGRLENNIRYFPSKLKLHGINASSVHCCFSQIERSFLPCCILRKLFKLFSLPHGLAEIRTS